MIRTKCNIQLPKGFVKLLFELKGNFTKSSFKDFEAILAGILLLSLKISGENPECQEICNVSSFQIISP